VWKIEQHRIICGDCTDETVTARLWSNGKARRLRLIWTDPPYGVSYADKTPPG
jgi:DNA modification methylase